LLPESEGDLVDLLGFILENPGLKFEISGHTDSTGTSSYNEVLSQRRAESVRNYLINNGLSPVAIMAKGYGLNQPIADNSTEKGREANRRTELRVITNR
jgi:outer membrane protein OmpA-like peptidoglycan-associated protein